MRSFELIAEAEKRFASSGIDSAKLDAEILLAHALNRSRFDILLDSQDEISDDAERKFNALVERRKLREPVAYIISKKEFWSMDVMVTKDVLIPRPETELVVEEALRFAKKIHGRFSFLDICTGSGCIAMAVAHEMPNSDITVTDKSNAALDVAKKNLAFASARTRFFEGDLFDPLPEHDRFDIITANPPYIALKDRAELAPEITEYEPELALFAEKDGLDLIERIIKTAPRFLKKDGSLIIEFGIYQSESICEMAKMHGFEIKIVKDFSGIDRVAVMTRGTNG